MNNKERAFILELTRLAREYGITIGGCGCCGSPWVVSGEDTTNEQAGYICDENGEGLRWITPDDEVAWENNHSDIIRSTENE